MAIALALEPLEGLPPNPRVGIGIEQGLHLRATRDRIGLCSRVSPTCSRMDRGSAMRARSCRSVPPSAIDAHPLRALPCSRTAARDPSGRWREGAPEEPADAARWLVDELVARATDPSRTIGLAAAPADRLGLADRIVPVTLLLRR